MTTPTFRTQGHVDRAPRPNKYDANCERCRARVPAGQGSLTMENGQWVVRHHGDCLATIESAPEQAPRNFSVPDGRYTVSFPDGSHKTIRVHTQDEDATFMPGRVVLEYLSGPSNDSDYTSFAHVNPEGFVKVWKKHRDNHSLLDAIKILLGNPQAAALGYAEQSGRCARCGRTLTVPTSIHQGFGPECATKVAW